MDIEHKDQLLEEAKERVQSVQNVITEETKKVDEQFLRYRHIQDTVSQKLAAHFAERSDELQHLFPSPYFVRCDIVKENGDQSSLYFAKYQLIEESIFSWTTPAARLRFSDIGAVEYSVSADSTWKGNLMRKDQFLISNSKIVFMTSESDEYPRTLVHQEQLTRRKTGFVLPEIVEQMERAQDDVIRAQHYGPFLISGPAGSGKTTLAFHRIAFLLQSPDTASIFDQDTVVAFVQDEQTKAYFSQLLPELGIHHVAVTTFAAWAFERLGLVGYSSIQRPNGVSATIDAYEHRKLMALRSLRTSKVPRSKPDPFQTLNAIYEPIFTHHDAEIFAAQTRDRALDRIDLTILLSVQHATQGFVKNEEYFVQKKNFEVTRKTKVVPLSYKLAVIDEVQNYLPEQIALLRSCISDETKSMLYVGDLAQQVLLGTLHRWEDAGEVMQDDRRVVLEKVYRSTKQILSYVQHLGFSVAVPDGLRDGAEVVEKVCENIDEEVAWIHHQIASDTGAQIGILGFTDAALAPFREAFGSNPAVHILTIHQSQGVEFDSVYIVGIRPDVFLTPSDIDPALARERSRIQRDLVYVGLTRAMDRLAVVGTVPLKNCVNW